MTNDHDYDRSTHGVEFRAFGLNGHGHSHKSWSKR